VSYRQLVVGGVNSARKKKNSPKVSTAAAELQRGMQCGPSRRDVKDARFVHLGEPPPVEAAHHLNMGYRPVKSLVKKNQTPLLIESHQAFSKHQKSRCNANNAHCINE